MYYSPCYPLQPSTYTLFVVIVDPTHAGATIIRCIVVYFVCKLSFQLIPAVPVNVKKSHSRAGKALGVDLVHDPHIYDGTRRFEGCLPVRVPVVLRV